MEVCDEGEKTPQAPTDINSNKYNVELRERTFELVHPVLNNKSGVNMVLPKEVCSELSQLQSVNLKKTK